MKTPLILFCLLLLNSHTVLAENLPLPTLPLECYLKKADAQPHARPFLLQHPYHKNKPSLLPDGYASCSTAEDLLDRIRENHCFLSNPHFNRFSLYSTGQEGSTGSSPASGIFFLQNDFPPEAPEIACIIHRYGDGIYKEKVLFYQRQEAKSDIWKEMVRFNLTDSIMPWGALSDAHARRIVLTPDSIIMEIGSINKNGGYYGNITCRFRLEGGIYRMRSLLVSAS